MLGGFCSGMNEMTIFDYSHSGFAVRNDVAEAYRRFWTILAQPGNWWDGSERVAIASASRTALACPFCERRKSALSPYQMDGEHSRGGEQEGVLNDLVIDAVHRIVTDQSRITHAYVQRLQDAGISKEHYVELVGVVVTCLSIDEFNRALGLPLEPLPEPQPGRPDGYRPEAIEEGVGFVPMLRSDGAVGPEADLWGKVAPNVVRALSLVPDAVRSWMQIANVQYAMGNLLDFSADTGRAIDRAQMELVAGRVSAINECFY